MSCMTCWTTDIFFFDSAHLLVKYLGRIHGPEQKTSLAWVIFYSATAIVPPLIIYLKLQETNTQHVLSSTSAIEEISTATSFDLYKPKPEIFGRIGDGGSSAMEITTLSCLMMFRWAKPIPCECGAVPQPFDGTNPLNNDILRPKTWRSQLSLTADSSSARDCVGQRTPLHVQKQLEPTRATGREKDSLHSTLMALKTSQPGWHIFSCVPLQTLQRFNLASRILTFGMWVKQKAVWNQSSSCVQNSKCAPIVRRHWFP